MSAANDVAKARILMGRAERLYREREAETNAAIQKLKEDLYPFRRAAEQARMRLYDSLEANGQCGICELPKAECPGHVLMAASA